MSNIEPRPDAVNVRWNDAEGRPQIAASLAELPEGVDFDDGFPEPIRFDAERGRLLYRGFMATSSYRFLLAQSHDLDYLRAINELSNKSTAALQPQALHKRKWPWLAAATAGLLAAAGLVGRGRWFH